MQTSSHPLAASSILTTLLPIVLPLSLITLSLLGLAACNGGGGGGGGPTDPGDGPVSFQGEVVEVDALTLILDDGTRVTVDEATRFDPEGDLFTVQGIEDALARGEVVTVEGTGERRSAFEILALEIRAETSAAGQPVRFDGVVSTLDRTAGRITLRNGLTLLFTGETSFDGSGDLLSFNQLVAAFDRGERIRVSGDGVSEADGDVRVQEIRAESESGTGGSTVFAGQVTSVERQNRRMFLTTGIVVAVDASTRFDLSGDLTSLGAVADAVAQGETVLVEGEGEFRADGSVLARQVRADLQ